MSWKRRKLIKYGLLASASIINVSLLKPTQAAPNPSVIKVKNNRFYDWIFLYWMPYSNNLSDLGTPIIDMLKSGVQSDNILVIVQADFEGAEQLSRFTISQNSFVSQRLTTADSASEEVLAKYLSWAKSKFQARKWAIVFLGHGGRLDEISPDAPSNSNLKTRWMNISKLNEVIVNFNKDIGALVELVFFQNCNKGTFEIIYTLRNAAKYTLSSQITLGAPNYYYKNLLQFVGSNPDIDGAQLATKVIDYERSDMYHSYTIITNKYISKLASKLNPLIETVLAANVDKIKLPKAEYSYFGDGFIDLINFLIKIVEQSNANQEQLKDFIDFCQHSVIYKFQQSGTLLGFRKKAYQNLSGIGLFLPKSRQQFEKYSYLPVYSDLKIVELFNTILFNEKGTGNRERGTGNNI